MSRNILYAIPLLFSMTGCGIFGDQTGLDYAPNLLRFQTPEVGGEFVTAEVQLSSGHSGKYRVADVSGGGVFSDETDYELIAKEKQLRRSGVSGLFYNLGLASRVDLVASMVSDAPYRLGLKYQFAGTPALRSSRGFKASIETAYTQTHAESTQSAPLTDAGITERTVNGWDMALNLGWRSNRQEILYLSPVRGKDHVLLRVIGGENVEHRAIYKESGWASYHGALLGYRFTTRDGGYAWSLEGGRFLMDMQGKPSGWRGALALSFTFRSPNLSK